MKKEDPVEPPAYFFVSTGGGATSVRSGHTFEEFLEEVESHFGDLGADEEVLKRALKDLAASEKLNVGPPTRRAAEALEEDLGKNRGRQGLAGRRGLWEALLGKHRFEALIRDGHLETFP